MKIRSMLVASLAMIAVVGCKEQAGTDAAGKGAEPKEKVEFAMHVMSQCPFGVQVENGFAPVLAKLGKAVDFRIYFIGDEPTPGQLTSMHGDNEVKGDLQHVCAMKHAPNNYMDLILCQNKNMRDIPNNFDACATEAKVDGAKIKACAEGDEGKALLSASFKVSKDKGARGSPTLFLAGAKYEGGRTENDFIRAICGKFTTAKPEVCKNIPEPKKIPLTVLSDARCKDCFPDRILGQLKNMFPGLEAKTVDYGTPEGKALYDGLKDKGAKLLPAFLFAPIVTEDPGFQQVQRFVADAGEYKLLQIGAKFDPTAELCDNTIDDDGNGQADCADAACKGKIVCRETKANQLDVFVMSQCPFGVKALNAMKEVLDAFKDDPIVFNVNFIADELPDGSFKALHGQPEVDENIRELCAIKYYPKAYKYMDYVLCRNGDIRSTEWQKCAVGGIDAKVIEKCFTGGEGKKLHSENIKLAKDLGIGASPTWLANNKNQFSGVAAEQVKKNFCAYNATLKGCAKTLSGDAKGPAGGCGAN
jgi:protein-disulfide isomerase